MHTDLSATAIVLSASNDNVSVTKLPNCINSSTNITTTSTDWRLWCRLCAKDDPQSNISVFFKDEQQPNGGGTSDVCTVAGSSDVGLAVAIGKYFWIEIKRDDELPKMLCTECFSLVTSLVNFSERVAKVQQMFCVLNSPNTVETPSVDFHEIRLKYGLLDEQREHVLVQQQLPEVHYFESKPKINDLEERIFGNETLSNPLEQPRIKIKIKKETVVDEELSGEELDDDDDEEFDAENILNDDYDNEDNENDDKNYVSRSAEDEENQDEKPLKLRRRTKQNLHKSTEEESREEVPKKRRRRRCRKPQPFTDDDELEDGDVEDDNDDDDEEEQKAFICSRKASEAANCEGKDENNPASTYICSDCPRKFKRVQHLRQHSKRAHVKVVHLATLTCTHCSKVFTTSRQLDLHVKMHLPPDQRKVIPCPYCDKKFSTHTLMQTHIKYIHMNERPFICEECGVAVRTNAALKTHMLTHTDYAPFECDVCKKGFKNQIRLKNHMETHDPNKHVCAECGLQLNSRATLNRHLLVHSDEMQHKCDYCGRAFKRAKALKNHLILHTGLKPYSCDFCDRTFANGSNCRSHKKKAHPEELAALEAAGGGRTYTRNIPKLEALKAVTKAADNLAPVVSKQSGRFAFGKKPKNSPLDSENLLQKSDCGIKPESENQSKQLSPTSSCAPLLLSTTSAATDVEVNTLHVAGGLHSQTSAAIPHMTTATAPIPNIDNIYSHIMKQATLASHNTSIAAPELVMHINKRPASQASSCVAIEHDTGTSDVPTMQSLVQANQQPTSVTAMPSHFYSEIIKQNMLQQEQQQQQQLHQQLHHHQQPQQHQHQQHQLQQHHHLSHLQMQHVEDVVSSVRSPDSQASSQLDDQSNAATASVQFYNHIRQNLQGPYI